METQKMNAHKILTRETTQYVADGYFVIQNNASGHVQISDEGLHIKSGHTMAVSEITAVCQKSIDKGLIKLLASPASTSDTSKKSKKKAEDAPVPPEAMVPAEQPPVVAPVEESVTTPEPVAQQESFSIPEEATEEISSNNIDKDAEQAE
jgi:hypothetical protein